MCTLTLAWQVFDEAPVAVAANRDESLGRPSAPPDVYGTDPTIIAPRDCESGGTWIGVNEHGLVAGITNRWTDASLAGDRSRGLLVADVLEQQSVTDAAAVVERETNASEYDGFHLVLADETAACCYTWDGELERIDFDPGVHVVVNVAVDDVVDIPDVRTGIARTQVSSARSVRETLAPEPAETVEGWLERAGDVLGDHDYGVCIHGDGYGTRSSSLVAVGTNPHYWFADGPPCRTTYEPINVEGHI